ncbi:hypothetical protein [Rhodobacter capsulatus]|uniref:hypothetical protein n=1 Tax=Rhodobacter capsulatus TaxID=1061 RepID=UPI0040251503
MRGILGGRISHRINRRGGAGGAVVSGDAPITVSAALRLYWELAADRTMGMSPDQERRWRNPRLKAIRNFLDIVGDKPIAEISADDMLAFRAWWLDRIREHDLTANSANKDFTHFNDVLRTVNRMKRLRLDLPLGEMAIKERERARRPGFSEAWIRTRLLAAGALDGLNEEARVILLTMISSNNARWMVASVCSTSRRSICRRWTTITGCSQTSTGWATRPKSADRGRASHAASTTPARRAEIPPEICLCRARKIRGSRAAGRPCRNELIPEHRLPQNPDRCESNGHPINEGYSCPSVSPSMHEYRRTDRKLSKPNCANSARSQPGSAGAWSPSIPTRASPAHTGATSGPVSTR